MQKHDLQLKEITERLSEFYTPDETRQWLEAGHPQLDGKVPHDLINEGCADNVIQVIDRLESCCYL